MANKFCTICAKYNECTWMQIKALNSPVVNLRNSIRHDDWMGMCCKYFVYDSNKGEKHEII